MLRVFSSDVLFEMKMKFGLFITTHSTTMVNIWSGNGDRLHRFAGERCTDWIPAEIANHDAGVTCHIKVIGKSVV